MNQPKRKLINCLIIIPFWIIAICLNAQNPVAYYPFNGNANDESGNGNNGTNNGATPTTDRFGNANSAFSFNGTTNYIQVPNSTSLQLTEFLTISVWEKVNPIRIAQNYATHLYSKGATFNVLYCDFGSLLMYPAGKTFFEINSVSTNSQGYSISANATALQNEGWHNIVTTFNAGLVVFYIDGVLIFQGTSSVTSIRVSEEPFYIGDRFYPNYYPFDGSLDDIRIYNRALTASEISQLYANYHAPNTLIAENSDKQITLKWSSERIAEITKYRIYQDGVKVDSVTVATSNDTVKTITGLTNYQNYQFYITSVDTAGNVSQPSDTVTVQPCELVSDFDGNRYTTVKIGNQYWMQQNLKVTHYQNGNLIPNEQDNSPWAALTNGAYCNYNNNVANASIYGRLYNFYAVADSRRVCPTGWHVPSDNEFKALEMYLGMTQGQADATGWRGTNQGTQLKSISGWNGAGNGTNTSGFNGIAAGDRHGDGLFYNLGYSTVFWSSTQSENNNGWERELNTTAQIGRLAYSTYGFSIRCLKGDLTILPTLQSPDSGSTNINSRPKLIWDDYYGAIKYHLQVSENSSFTTTVFDDSTLTINHRQVGPLACNRTYYWRIRVKQVGGWTSFTPAWKFKTKSAPAYSTVSIRKTITSPGSNVHGLTFDGKNLWMIDALNHVYKMDTAGNVLSSFTYSGSTDTDLSWDGEGLWIGGSPQIKVDSLGNRLDTLAVYYWNESGIEWDGKFFRIGDYNLSNIHKHSLDGANLGYFNTSALWGHPTGISYDGVNFWIGDSGEGSDSYSDIYKFSPSGSLVASYNVTALGIPRYWGFYALAWDGESLWYASIGGTTIYRLNVPYYHQAPEVPVIISPANNATDQPLNLTLTWNESIDATNYRVQVSKNQEFTKIIIDNSTITTTSYSPAGLINGSNYFWRVAAISSGYASSFSDIYKFTTVSAIPSTPVIIAPKDGAQNQNISQTLSWHPASGDAAYQLELGTEASLTSGIIITSTDIHDTTFIAEGLAHNSTYYWHVKAYNQLGASEYSAVYHFSTGSGFYVDAVNGNNSTGDGSQSKPWKTITKALEQMSGIGQYTIHVAAGTYNTALGESFPLLMIDSVSLIGAGPNLTRIDAESNNTVIKCIGILDSSTRLEGFTITNGKSTASGSAGGIYVSSGSTVRIINNIITSNRAEKSASGGAIYILNASPTVDYNLITYNHGQVINQGACIYITGSTSSPSIKNNTITNNTNDISDGGVVGAGTIIISSSAQPTIWGNIITNNYPGSSYGTSTDASEIFINNASPILKYNVIAKSQGNGILIYQSGSSPIILNNTICDNKLHGIQISSGIAVSITNNIIAYNLKYGIYEGSTSCDPLRVAYNLFYQNASGLYYDEAATAIASVATLNSTVVECKNNLSGNPSFVNRANNNYHLNSGSQAINNGDPSGPTDTDGSVADIGAFTYQSPPAAPANLSAEPGNGIVILKWNQNQDDDIAQYNIYGGTISNPYIKIDSTTNGLSDTTKTISGLTNGLTYYFRIKAVNSAGLESDFSNEVSAVPVLPDVAPQAPQNLTAVPGNQEVTLKWSQNTESDFMRYRIYGGPEPNLTTKIDSTTDNQISDTVKLISGLINGIEYYYRLTAVDTAGLESDFSNQAAAIPSEENLPPLAPVNLMAIPGNGMVTLKWQPNTEPDLLRYRIYGGTEPNPILKIDSTTNGINDTVIELNTLFNGTTYYYRITAVDNSGLESDFSNEVSAIPSDENLPPEAPVNLVAQAGNQKVTLHWNPNSEPDFLRYRIYGGPSLDPSTLIDSTHNGINDTIIVIAGLTNNVSYNFWVTAVDNTGLESNASNPVSAIPIEAFTDLNLPIYGTKFGEAEWGDFDHDGHLDIIHTGVVAGSGNPTAELLKNNGNGTFITQTQVLLTGVTNSSIDWGDFNNDGFLDILLTGSDGHNPVTHIFENNGENDLTRIDEGTITGFEMGSSKWGDYDNDGDLDILLTGIYMQGAASLIYRNDGANGFTKLTDTPIIAVYASSVDWGDYDNDDDLDILLTGGDNDFRVSKIYTNQDGSFVEETSISLTGLNESSAQWGDYDNDGDLDILITGNNGTSCSSLIYRNDGNRIFTKMNEIKLQSVKQGSISWGDYNNDGLLDMAMMGYNDTVEMIKIYQQSSDHKFIEEEVDNLTPAKNGSISWGDYDNDGDLDILMNGGYYGTPFTKVYRNNCSVANTKPGKPGNLKAIQNGDEMILSWDAATDLQTSSEALSYNIRIGTTSGGRQIISPNSLPDGKILIPKMGNTQLGCTFKMKDLPIGGYFWSVQAVDNGYLGGNWADEQGFTVINSGILVKVVDQNDQGIENVNFTFNPDEIFSGLSSASGEIGPYTMPPGTYSLNLNKTGYFNWYNNIEITDYQKFLKVFLPKLADYDGDQAMDLTDLDSLITNWRAKNATLELGPVTGTIPQFTVDPDGVLDFEDLMVFALMWDYTNSSPQRISKTNDPGNFETLNSMVAKPTFLADLNQTEYSFVWLNEGKLLSGNLEINLNLPGEIEVLNPELSKLGQVLSFENKSHAEGTIQLSIGLLDDIEIPKGTEIFRVRLNSGALPASSFELHLIDHHEKGTVQFTQTSASEIQVFPNPASNQLTIIKAVAFKAGQAYLRDITGKILKSVTLDDINLIDISQIPGGVLIIEVITDQEREFFRVVKE